MRQHEEARVKHRKSAPDEKHECEAEGCKRLVALRFRFCRKCSGKTRRPNVDAMTRRLPGSYGTRQH
jgi:hypothetical protein